MIKHIVFFKLKPEFRETKDFACGEIVSTLQELPSKIEFIREYELGINFAEKETAYDVALISSFDTQEDLDKYRNHPAHVQAVEKIRYYVAQTAFVDYQI